MKTPVGSGRFRSSGQLGGSWVFQLLTRPFGGLLKNRVNSQNHQRTVDAFELVTATGLPALMTRAVWV